MNLAEPIRHVGIKPGDKRNACGAAEPSRSDTRDGQTEHEGKGRDDPADAHTRRHVTNSLNDSLEHADLIFANCDKQGKSRADVKRTGKNAAPGDCARKSLARVFNFVAHDGCEFQADETEADDAERVQNKTGICRNPKIRGGYRSSEAKQNNDAKTD